MASPEPQNPEIMLAEDIADFTHDPLGYAEYAFPWGEGTLEGVDGPRGWQADTMNGIGLHLRNPETRFEPLRIAVASGHGIGKSADISMIICWALDTCEDTRIVVTANTESQLRTKTWPEVIKWRNLSITKHWWKVTKTGIFSLFAGHQDSWRCDAVTWSEHNTEAFAGLHNKGKRIVIITDESSNIADKVWEVIEGALTDEETEIIWIAFGNPTRNTGRFRECFGRYRHLWKSLQIDSRKVEGTNKKYLQSLVDTYGENSDIVKVRVRGQFPSASSLQFISSAVVATARTRDVPVGLPTDPIIFGIDCARFGDDHSTLAIRCGRDARTRPWKRWHQVDAMTIAGDIAIQAALWKPDAIFVDAGNIGAAIVDRLRQIGIKNVYEVWFGGKGRDAEWATGVPIRTANKRAEMYASMRGWLVGGAIPDNQQLEDDLTGVEYGYNADQEIQLEKKEHMKARGLASPDDGDALACTFAEPVMPRVPKHRDPHSYVDDNHSQHDRYSELN